MSHISSNDKGHSMNKSFGEHHTTPYFAKIDRIDQSDAYEYSFNE